jgi:Ssp1 endopeptidase immunity protein Rap1a
MGSAAGNDDPEVASLWFDRCSRPDLGSQAACTSFIFGVNELHTLLRLHKKVELYCPTGDVTVGDFRNMVVMYMQQHPDDLHKAFVVLILEALREAFPCSDRT